MTLDRWLVLTGGAAAIGWVLWYFFFARKTVAAAGDAGGVQQVRVAVLGGYDPAVIEVQVGRPVRLLFDRQETSSCSEEVVFPDFRIRRFLPTAQVTAIEFTPERPGQYEFTCGMGMLRGKLIVR